MRKVPITLTLPENIIRDLHQYTSKRGMSNYVAGLIEKGLKEKKEWIARELRAAAQDEERNAEIEEWDTLIGIDEGLDETNRY